MTYAGLIENLAAADYHSAPGVSNSLLKHLATSPAHCKAAMEGKIKSTAKSLIFGSRFHMAVLEPELFAATYVCVPEGMKLNKKDGMDWANAQTKEPIPFYDWQNFIGMAKAMHDHKTAGPLIRSKGRNEISVFKTHPRTGLPLRSRYDRLLDNGVIVDLKSCQSAKPFNFMRDAAKYRYFCQSSFYQKMVDDCAGMIFVGVETSAPYNVLCCEFDAESIAKGTEEVERLLDLYKQCSEANHWPGYSDSCELLSIPAWALKEQPFESATPYELEN